METDPLRPDRIAVALPDRRVGRWVLVFQTLASTSDRAWNFAGKADSDGLCVFAEEQTAGRGRHGRQWLSANGQALLFSVLLNDCSSPAETLTLASAVAVADVLADTTGTRVGIKWPNDVLLNGKKVCGILVEKRTVEKRPCVVIGIGVNIRQDAAFFETAGLSGMATSVAMDTGHVPDRSELAGRLLTGLDDRLRQAQTDPRAILADWKRANHQVGSRIALRHANRTYRGTCLGVDPAEGLIVQLDNGPVRLFPAAQTSVIPEPA